MTASTGDTKKALLSALTEIARTHLTVDPKQFMMMLHGSYAAICREGTLDLQLLWDSLKDHHPESDLIPTFMKFEEAAVRIGLRPVSPRGVAAFSAARPSADTNANRGSAQAATRRTPSAPAFVDRRIASDDRATESNRADVQSPAPVSRPPSGPAQSRPVFWLNQPPASVQMGHDSQTIASTSASGDIHPAALSTTPAVALERDEALTPLPNLAGPEFEPTPLPDVAYGGNADLNRRITTALSSILKATPAGPHLKTAQISFFIASNFESLCDGRQFFFERLYKAMIELSGVEESHLYLAAVRFRRFLARIGMELVEPDWKLSDDARMELEAQSRVVAADVYTRTHSLPPSQESASLTPDVGQIASAPDAQARTDRIAETYGFEVAAKKRTSWGRLAVLIIALCIGALVWTTAGPLKRIPSGSYTAVFPLSDAKLFNGQFLGTVDLKAWQALTVVDRKKALSALAEVLKRENRLKGARIVHPTTHGIVAWDMKDGLMGAAQFIETGNLDSKASPASGAK